MAKKEGHGAKKVMGKSQATTSRPTHFLFPHVPGKGVKPVGQFFSEEDARAAQSNYSLKTIIVSW
jgi:hypothetical protein